MFSKKINSTFRYIVEIKKSKIYLIFYSLLLILKYILKKRKYYIFGKGTYK